VSRLAWKEFRENLWMLLVTLLCPLAVLLFMRFVLGSREPWNQGPAGVLILIEFVIFGTWGAMRMSPERAVGWLTLRTLPVPVWQVWLLKLAAGVAWAVACAACAYWMGSTILPGPRTPESAALWVIASGLALCYTVGFVASLFFASTASGVLGTLGGSMGWFALAVLGEAVGRSSDVPSMVTIHYLLWIPPVILAVLALWVMSYQAKGASLKRTGAVLVAAFAVVLAILIVPRLPHLGQTRMQFYKYGGPSMVPCPETAQYADTEFIYAGVRRDREAKEPITGMQLWARSVDGQWKRLVASGDKRLTPLVWTSKRQLIYVSEAFRSERARLMQWDPRTGKSSIVAEMDTIPNELWYLLAQTGVAAEPGGDRIAFARVTSGRLDYDHYLDLWVMNLRTGEGRLLWPNISGREVLWRAGRIYLRSSGDLMAISPEGGRLEPAHSLPPATREEAR